MGKLQANAADLERELNWFSQVLDTRLKLYFGQDSEHDDIFAIAPPDASASPSPFAEFVRQHELTFAERLALILGLTPHIRPRLLDVFFTKNKTFDRQFTEFGGDVVGGAFLPTGQTLAFVLAADELATRFAATQFLLDREHVFARADVLRLVSKGESGGEPVLNGRLQIAHEYVVRFTTGERYRPDFSIDFPAKHVTTELGWDDLVLADETQRQLEELRIWIRHSPTLLHEWGFAKKLRPGYRSLFYGPPGTGKTMTACLLGKFAECDVYKIDLSQVISKYIGETEKNLSRLFDVAQHKGWILFFDEADALFGKRTQTKDAHDRYANQEVAYLLQRIEDYDGIAILASNMKGNIDAAFLRRFESVIHFPMPGPADRLRLWQNGFSQDSDPAEIDLKQLANEHELTGAAIMNVIRDSSLAALSRDSPTILSEDVSLAIVKEQRKQTTVSAGQ